MKDKVVKVLIGIIVAIVVILEAFYLIDFDKMNKGEKVIFSTWGRKYAPIEKQAEAKPEQTEPEPTNTDIQTPATPETDNLVTINGKKYKNTGKESEIKARCGVMDGEVNGYGYQYVSEDRIDLRIGGKFIVFEQVK